MSHLCVPLASFIHLQPSGLGSLCSPLCFPLQLLSSDLWRWVLGTCEQPWALIQMRWVMWPRQEPREDAATASFSLLKDPTLAPNTKYLPPYMDTYTAYTYVKLLYKLNPSLILHLMHTSRVSHPNITPCTTGHITFSLPPQKVIQELPYHKLQAPAYISSTLAYQTVLSVSLWISINGPMFA